MHNKCFASVLFLYIKASGSAVLPIRKRIRYAAALTVRQNLLSHNNHWDHRYLRCIHKDRHENRCLSAVQVRRSPLSQRKGCICRPGTKCSSPALRPLPNTHPDNAPLLFSPFDPYLSLRRIIALYNVLICISMFCCVFRKKIFRGIFSLSFLQFYVIIVKRNSQGARYK